MDFRCEIKRRYVLMKRPSAIRIFAFLVIATATASFLIVDVYNAARPLMLADDGQACLNKLADHDVLFKSLGSIKQKQCSVKNAVRIEKFSKTSINMPITVSCDFGIKLQNFFEKLQTKKVEHIGAMNCRQVRGSQILSEHSFGNAIDLTDFDSANVSRDWNKDSEEGKLLHNAKNLACEIFSNVLTPDSDSRHSNHIHLDAGPGFGC